MTGPGIACGADCSESYPNGTLVTLIATAAPGSRFVGWSGAYSGTDPTCTVTIDEAEHLIANFERDIAGVRVSRVVGGSPPTLLASLTARSTCGPIDHIEFGEAGRPFANARITITSPTGGPAGQTTGFSYRPPGGTWTVSFTIQRVVQSGGATVSPIVLRDGCGDWRTFVGGGPDAFR